LPNRCHAEAPICHYVGPETMKNFSSKWLWYFHLSIHFVREAATKHFRLEMGPELNWMCRRCHRARCWLWLDRKYIWEVYFHHHVCCVWRFSSNIPTCSELSSQQPWHVEMQKLLIRRHERIYILNKLNLFSKRWFLIFESPQIVLNKRLLYVHFWANFQVIPRFHDVLHLSIFSNTPLSDEVSRWIDTFMLKLAGQVT
jgi:hypothetical protein